MLDEDGSEHENGEVVEITDHLYLRPDGSRLIVRPQRAHPGAQLSFTDHDGYRFQAILTDQTDPDTVIIERRHRQRARVDPRRQGHRPAQAAVQDIRHERGVAGDRDARARPDRLTQALVLDGELAKAEPKRLRYRLLHVAARLAFSGRHGKLHLPAAWPSTALEAGFEKLKTLPAASS